MEAAGVVAVAALIYVIKNSCFTEEAAEEKINTLKP